MKTSWPLLFWTLLAAHLGFAGDPDGLQIIDVHTHTWFSGKLEPTSRIPLTEAEYFQEMKDAGIVAAIAHTTPASILSGVEGGYRDLRKKNVIHCLGLRAKEQEKELEDELKSGKYGCLKIYLGYIHQYAYDENYLPAYRLAEKFKIPVVFHTGDTYSATALLKYAHPLTIDEVAVKYPQVTFVIAHAGNPWIRSAAEVAYKNPNVYLDLSAFGIGDLRKQSQQKLNTYIIEPLKWIYGYVDNPKKLMFGSDWPLVQMKPYVALVKKAVPKQHWKAVFHDNAAGVFKLF